MEIESIARKLEPLKPKEVAHWRRVRDTADAETRSLLDKHLIGLAYETLGDFRRKTLLSLPPKSKARGRIKLGTLVYDKEKYSFGLSESELLQHLAIFGRSGSGKTNLVFHILDQLTKLNVKWAMADWKRTGRHAIPLFNKKVAVYTPGKALSPLPFNPFVPPPGLEPHLYINLLVDILAGAYQLGEGAQRVLQHAIDSSYRGDKASPSVADVLHEAKNYDGRGRARGWQMSAIRAIESLAFAGIGSGTAAMQVDTINQVLNGFSVIELNGLDEAAKKVITQALALWIYYAKLASKAREKLDFVLILEEAHHVLLRGRRRSETILERLLREAREVGIGIILVDQHCSMISKAGLGNSYSTILLNQKDPADISTAASICQLEGIEKSYLAQLPIGQAICQLQDRWTKPVLLNIPHLRLPKGAVADSLLEAYMAGTTTLSGLRMAVEKEGGEYGRSRVLEVGVSNDEIDFLIDVVRYRSDGVDARYKRLGWSADKGNRIKSVLLRVGLLNEESVQVGRTRRSLLRLTGYGMRIAGYDLGKVTRESIAHEFWKLHWADKLRRDGYQVQIEAPRVGGRVDVLATRAGESVAVEIETGKSDVVGNVKNCLLSGFKRVKVVAIDRSAIVGIEKRLLTACLLIPNRVAVVNLNRSTKGIA